MKTITTILSMSGRTLNRSIHTDSEGKEYILHARMKAYLKDEKTIDTGSVVATVKRVEYYA